MMKFIHFIALLFPFLVAGNMLCAQTVNVNRLQVRDSLSLGNKWISTIKADSAMLSIDAGSISVDGAWKYYIDQQLSSNSITASTGNRRDSLLTIDPSSRKLALARSPYDAALSNSIFFDPPLFLMGFAPVSNMSDIFQDSITITCISSDSITTVLSFRGNLPDWDFAKGKPPFSLRFKWVNVYPGKLIQLINNWYNFNINANGYDNNSLAKYGDTLIADMDGVSGGMFYRLAIIPDGMSPAMPLVHIAVKNNSASQQMGVYDGSDTHITPPGTIHQFAFCPADDAGNGSIILYANQLIINTKGEIVPSALESKTLIASIYQNSTLLSQVTLTAGFSDPVTVNSNNGRIEIILEENIL